MEELMCKRAFDCLKSSLFASCRLKIPAVPVAFCLLLLAAPSQASTSPGITLVQHNSIDAGTASSSTLAFGSQNTAGNWIAVCIRAGAINQVFTVSDSNKNYYRKAFQSNQTSDGFTIAVFYAENIAGGVNAVTVSDAYSNTLRFAILEYSGVTHSHFAERHRRCPPAGRPMALSGWRT